MTVPVPGHLCDVGSPGFTLSKQASLSAVGVYYSHPWYYPLEPSTPSLTDGKILFCTNERENVMAVQMAVGVNIEWEVHHLSICFQRCYESQQAHEENTADKKKKVY